MVSLEDAAHIGEVVGGISTAFAVALAAYQLRRWRGERLRERRADVAARAVVELRRCGHVLQRGHVAVDSAIALPLHCKDVSGACDAAQVAVQLLRPKIADIVAKLQEAEIASAAVLTAEETHALGKAQVLADVFIENLENKIVALDTFANDEPRIRTLLGDMVKDAVATADAAVAEGSRGAEILKPIVELRAK